MSANILYTLAALTLIGSSTYAQTIAGKVANKPQGIGLAGKRVVVYVTPQGGPQQSLTTTTATNGTFSTNVATSVQSNIGQTPTDFAVSEAYPNPFNPMTRMRVFLPERAQVSIELHNILGQKVLDVLDRMLDAGTHVVDFELNAYANGVYLARTKIGEGFSATRKLLLVYGTQHAVQGPVSFEVQSHTGDLFRTDSLYFN